ncbi:DUF6232 family protein [Micromonospora sp. WMMA1363]|uniref:DUF6232 family protein n=1 Tax=Micromonospora sp. WMMA1363 TaxID=3053985 RepID=UPI00259CC9D7|nr:DUF6232 family protein [Micromonospora sp. WMMA1363]MDM4720459.1 DUF6232 family protein [Micromonospora sp. WMMA1363]
MDPHPTTPPTSSPHGAGSHTTLLYARPGIVVTVDRLTIGHSSWPVAELTHLHTTRGPHDRVAVRAVLVTGGMISGVGLLLGFTGGLHRLTAGAYLTIGAVFLLPVLLAVAGDRWRPPAYELWGRLRGTDELLFASDDERQFGQVTRALRRALEMRRHGGWEDPLAPAAPWRPGR